MPFRNNIIEVLLTTAVAVALVSQLSCVQGGKKNITTGNATTTQPVRIDASEQFVTVKMLESATIESLAKLNATISTEIRSQVTAQVAAQINQVNGKQINNSTWIVIALIAWPGVLTLIDKVSRRSKTIRKIDAAVKGVKQVTVSE